MEEAPRFTFSVEYYTYLPTGDRVISIRQLSEIVATRLDF